MDRAGTCDQKEAPIVGKDDPVNLAAGEADNFAWVAVFGMAFRSLAGLGRTRVARTLISEVFCKGGVSISAITQCMPSRF